MQTRQETRVNGVPTDRLVETMNAIRGKPEVAKFVFRSTNRWIDGGHNRARIKGFFGACAEDLSRVDPFVVNMDEPPVLLGTDKAANPV
mgnify:FL=1